ncbi:uncharacterized protein V1516DRAFT_679190 [Lipomyces oligophaga]|uniref:uncharacterized protein n=1 Tax=Lipomyces oligophaga TaxID=45792 RepID=UPI0034CEA7EE
MSLQNPLGLFSLKGKTALITGASTGIGLAVATAFAHAGANIVLGYNSSTKAIETAAELAKSANVQVLALHIPVADSTAVEDAFDQAVKMFSTIDIVVSNAGVAWTAGELIAPPTDEEWNQIVNVNVNGCYHVAKCAGRLFKAQQSGSLIFTSSMSAQIVNIPQHQAAYNISKAAVTAMSKNLAVEWAGFARVNSVSPGYTITEITSFADKQLRKEWTSMIPLRREASTSELVGAYLYLASDASTYTTGADIIIDGGYTLV